ncbi:MAG: DUF393 domain-containing protein [Novosphingobium sp.]|nr:DUF393 domain-containing protein [Novosphingobium sp.]MCP5404048.1 DUF393 domain-containing protein [Novosphingobium sp.]
MAERETSLIIYDGQCVFCSNYVRFMRLRDTVGHVELIDARTQDPRIGEYWSQGYDLNEGMLFVHRGIVLFGADAIHALAGLSSTSAFLSRLNRLIFSNRFVARALYPFMKLGRRVTLFLLRRKMLDPW